MAARPSSPVRPRAIGGTGFDRAMVGLCTWFPFGAYLDAWAHTHVPELETFFTPWHAVLYSGFLAAAALTVATAFRNHARGDPWTRVLPAGYDPSLLGVLIFAAGGVGDMLWHLLFGVEVHRSPARPRSVCSRSPCPRSTTGYTSWV